MMNHWLEQRLATAEARQSAIADHLGGIKAELRAICEALAGARTDCKIIAAGISVAAAVRGLTAMLRREPR